jgi:hypothetical protein
MLTESSAKNHLAIKYPRFLPFAAFWFFDLIHSRRQYHGATVQPCNTLTHTSTEDFVMWALSKYKGMPPLSTMHFPEEHKVCDGEKEPWIHGRILLRASKKNRFSDIYSPRSNSIFAGRCAKAARANSRGTLLRPPGTGSQT